MMNEYPLPQNQNMEIQGEERVKKIALWAFQPALRGGFNYTLLELKDSATVLNNSGKVHGVICVVDR